ncbi:hypothetical protein MSG28_008351, partial [Choristoneura fumiferana]
RHRRRHKRIRTTSTEAPAAAAARGDAGVREETESEHLELGMAERLDEKRFQNHAAWNIISRYASASAHVLPNVLAF